MTTEDFITILFCRVDDQLVDAKKHTQAKLYPSEVVTMALLFSLKGVGNRAFYRWLKRDYLDTLYLRIQTAFLFSAKKWTRIDAVSNYQNRV
jgi:hypothetical protein